MPEKSALDLLKSIREALQAAHGSGSLRQAASIVKAFSDNGQARLADAETPDALEAAAGRLLEDGFGIKWNLDPAASTERPPTDDDEEDEDTLTDDAYHTALVLMAMTEGNPLTAALNCSLLASASGDEELYTEVVMALCRAFPFLEEMLRQQGVVASGA